MRHLDLAARLLGVSLLLAGCSVSTPASPPAAPVDWHAFDAQAATPVAPAVPTAKERAIAEAYEAALASPRFAKLAALLDDDVRLTFPGMDDAHGKDAVLHSHEVLLGAFDPRTVTTIRVFRTDSIQSVEWVASGTQAREWMSVPASRKPAVIKGLTLLWTKDDGTITDIHVYFDVAAVKAQLGVGPKELLAQPPPAAPPGPAQVLEQAGTPEEAASVAVGRAAIDALENDNEAGYVAGRTDDTEYYTLERAQPDRGKDAARGYFKAMRKAIGQLDTAIDNEWGIGAFSILEYSITGEQLGPIGWIPSQRNKVIRLHVAQVNEIRDGKIARVWRYENPLEIVNGP
jgi:ketosteroid isomerase-like protein